MTERCEVLVVGSTDAAMALAQGLDAYGVDVRLSDPEAELVSLLELEKEALEQTDQTDRTDAAAQTEPAAESGPVGEGGQPGALIATLRDDTESVIIETAFVATVADAPAREGRRLRLHSVRDAENLSWKLASVIRGAADMLLDTYATERAGDPKDYRASPLSQRFGGKRTRVQVGQKIPDDLVAWDPAAERDVRLWPDRRWIVIGLGSAAAISVQAAINRFGERIDAHVIGGGHSPSDVVTLLDRYGHVNRRLAKRGGSVLAIRPDGYVGLHTAPDPEIVVAYLEDLIPRGGDEGDIEEDSEGTADPAETFSPEEP